MSECLASKREKKQNARYTLSQSTINLSESERQELKTNLDNYLKRSKI